MLLFVVFILIEQVQPSSSPCTLSEVMQFYGMAKIDFSSGTIKLNQIKSKYQVKSHITHFLSVFYLLAVDD